MRDADWLDAEQAAALLAVRRATLYAYVSRGLVRARKGARGGSLYSRRDLELLRARSQARRGHAAVAGAALSWGEPVLDTRVSAIGANGPEYRGHSAVALAARGVSAELAAELLWTGKLHAHVQWPAADRREVARAARVVGDHREQPMLAMIAALSAQPTWPLASAEEEREHARRLVRLLALVPALHGSPRVRRDAERARGLARALLISFGTSRREHAEAAINRALVSIADHELNASTFAARVAASAGADLPRCLAAALATLSGQHHGGMLQRIEAWLERVQQPERVLGWVREGLAARRAIPGFGHVLYPDGDPRAAPLLDAALALAPDDVRVRTLAAANEAMALAGAERATVDLGLVAVAAALGWPMHAADALFAVGRCLGYVAHVLEQRLDGRLLRPRARFLPTP